MNIVEITSESYPRVSYFLRRLKCIMPRMKRIVDYELESQAIGRLRSEIDSVKTQSNEVMRALHGKVFKSARIAVVGDLKGEILRELKRNNCKECTQHENMAGNCLIVIGIEFVNIRQLKDDLDKILRQLATTSSFSPHNIVLVLQDSIRITQNTLKAIQDTVNELRNCMLNELKCTLHFDIQNQLVLLPASLLRSKPSSPSRPHLANEPSTKQMAMSATGSAGDIVPLRTHDKTEEMSNRLVAAQEMMRKSPSPPTSLSSSPMAPPSPSKVIQQSVERMNIGKIAPIAVPKAGTTGTTKVSRSLREQTRDIDVRIVTRSMGESFDSLKKAHKSKHATKSNPEKNVHSHSQSDSESSNAMAQEETADCIKTRFYLNQAISYQLETGIIDLVEDIENMLQEIKTKRDNEAGEELFTNLDKLLFEIRGLYHQSISKKGVERKEQAEKMRMSQELLNAVLSVDHVRGCGRIYGKINIHIEEVDDAKKEEIETNIARVVERIYHPRPTPKYVVDKMSVPTLFGHMIICSS